MTIHSRSIIKITLYIILFVYFNRLFFCHSARKKNLYYTKDAIDSHPGSKMHKKRPFKQYLKGRSIISYIGWNSIYQIKTIGLDNQESNDQSRSR